MLGFQRCAGCGGPVFYPRVLCPVCWGKDLTWETSSGLGVVYATTAVHRRKGDPYNGVLVHGNGGVLSSQVTAVLGSESTP